LAPCPFLVEPPQALDFGGGSCPVLNDGGLVVSVPPKQAVDGPEPGIELGDGARVVIDGLGKTPGLVGHIGELRLEPGETIGERLEAGVQSRDPTRFLQCHGRRVACPAAFLGERLAKSGRSPGDRLAMLCRGQTRSDLVGLTWSQVRAGDLSGLMFEQVDPPSNLAGVQRGLVERRAVHAPTVDGAGHARAQLVVAAEPVEQVALPALVEEATLIVLAMDLDERAHLVDEPSRGDGRVVDPSGRTAACGDLADRDQRFGQSVEQCLDAGRVRAVADQRRVRARPERQSERIDEQALARPRLSGDDVEAAIEVDAQPVDQRQVRDGQFEEAPGRPFLAWIALGHDGSSSTLWRSRSQNGWAPFGSIRRIGCSRAWTSTRSPTAIGRSSRPSIETRASWASTTRQRTTCRGLTTTERMAERYAAIGVTTRLRLTGSRIGPPAEKE
jgi:hypothetical protein